MKKGIKKILCFPLYIFLFIKKLLIAPFYAFKLARQKSYFSSKKRNTFIGRFFSFFNRFLFNRNFGEFYYLYGLDSINKDRKKLYLNESEFWQTASAANGLANGSYNTCFVNSQIFLLRNKLSFFEFLKNRNFPTPEIFGVILNGKIMDVKFQNNIECIISKKDYFLKDANGQCGSFVKHINDFSELKSYEKIYQKGLFILQEKVTQCEELSNLYSHSINTIRIVTLYNNGEPIVFSSVLRIGTSKSGNIDNYSAGGIVVGIDEFGNLSNTGFFKPKFGTSLDSHPDTHFIFNNLKIPFYKEACEKAVDLHKYFYGVFSIGWDVAITKNGPIFIEGNDNWEISLMQGCNGPLKEKWTYYIEKRKI